MTMLDELPAMDVAGRTDRLRAALAGAGCDALDAEGGVADLGQLGVGRFQDRVLESGAALALDGRCGGHRRHRVVIPPRQDRREAKFTKRRLRSLSRWFYVSPIRNAFVP